MRKFKTKLTHYPVKKNEKIIFEKEGKDYSSIQEAGQEIKAMLWQRWQAMGAKEGEKISFNVQVDIECTMNRRAEPRAPGIIRYEKAQRTMKRNAAALQEQKAEKERVRRLVLLRERIKNQIDYAFKSGHQSGTEPVAKYITCGSCNAPATHLYLDRSIPPGAIVLDESAIVGAVCEEDNYASGNGNYYRQNYGVEEIFPCSRLEFFYDGIRQIGIKEKP
jgi:hypothetical protein